MLLRRRRGSGRGSLLGGDWVIAWMGMAVIVDVHFQRGF